MSDPFASALAVLHGAAGSVAAVYQPFSGAPVALRLIKDQHSRDAGFGQSTYRLDAQIFTVRRADVARPGIGDTIAIGDDMFEVADEPTLDTEALSWTFGATLVPA